MSSGAKESVALSSVFASAGMAAMKLAVGLLTGSLGILSEAAHSLLDLGAASLTWFAVRIGDQPADERHPYGHAKFESVSALIGTGLLFVTSAFIVKEAVGRLLSPGEPAEATWYSMAVIAVSIVIDIGRSRALSKVAKETGSHALEADALHFSSDILSSAVVLAGLGFVAMGWAWADSVAAIGVAGFVALAGWRLGRQTVEVLVDTAPEGVAERIHAAAAAAPGVARVERVRARPAGTVIFVEAVVKVSRTLPLEQVERLRRDVALRVRAAVPETQTLVVAEPLTLSDETIAETVRVLAAARGLSVHNVGVATVEGRPHVSFDLEVDEALTIAAAHAQASELEDALQAELGPELVVDTHIDPRRIHVFAGTALAGPELAATQAALDAALAATPLAKSAHDLRVQQREDGLFASCHCLFPDNASIREVHAATERIEFAILRGVPGMSRVVVHAEPLSHPEAAENQRGIRENAPPPPPA
ncbi:MAG: cation diffusion facilitator family transporter [Magnetospirillum sp.]|nr:cation diffusion facilitator family transporter [Magnetospirillum sp.]